MVENVSVFLILSDSFYDKISYFIAVKVILYIMGKREIPENSTHSQLTRITLLLIVKYKQ